MLKKKFRLPKATRLTASRLYKTPFFTFKTAKNGLVYNRYAFIVSKRVDKRAVVRNRVKRRVRSCIEENLTLFVTGFDVIFIIRKEAVEATRKTLCSIMLEIMKKEGYIQ